jgi:Holliday junction resolvase
MKKGFEVFRALSPHASCDLIALKDGKLLRVEARVGRVGATGIVYTNRGGVHDVLAVALTDSVQYNPEIAS